MEIKKKKKNKRNEKKRKRCCCDGRDTGQLGHGRETKDHKRPP